MYETPSLLYLLFWKTDMVARIPKFLLDFEDMARPLEWQSKKLEGAWVSEICGPPNQPEKLTSKLLLCDIKIKPAYSIHLALWTEFCPPTSKFLWLSLKIGCRRKKLWLNEVKKEEEEGEEEVGPRYGSISILTRRDTRELTLLMHTARWEPSTSQEKGDVRMKLTLPTPSCQISQLPELWEIKISLSYPVCGIVL